MLFKGFRIDDHMPTDVLLLLFRDPDQAPERRWAACVALGAKTDPGVFETLVEALRAPEWQIRRFALEALRRHPRSRDAEPQVIARLFDVHDQVRQTACKICAELRLTNARGGLQQLLHADNPHVRDAALGSLGALWRDGDFDTVFEMYRDDRQRAVRIAAAKVLRARAGPRTWRTLFNAWFDDRETRHRMWACELAARFGSREDVPAIVPLREDQNQNVRRAAREALSTLGAER